jgi:cytochrome c peroxidase
MIKGKMLLSVCIMATVLLIALAGSVWAQSAGPSSTLKERVGKLVFFDKNLSDPPGQACAACHSPEVGWTGPDPATNINGGVYEGAVKGHFGNRKPPAAAYAGDSPALSYVEDVGWVGGMFWDGRATGETLGDPLAEQAQGPFLNPLEQNNADAQAVCLKVKKASYAGMFKAAWGPDALDCEKDAAGVYEKIARSIAAFERSSEVSAYTSKFDAYLLEGEKLTPQEDLGLKLFEGKAKCASGHPARTEDGEPLPFTDFTYDNLGLPKNPMNPFYGEPDSNPAEAGWVVTRLAELLGWHRDAGLSSDSP